jgi:hypothetical protein
MGAPDRSRAPGRTASGALLLAELEALCHGPLVGPILDAQREASRRLDLALAERDT